MKNLNLFFLVIALLAMVACGKKTDTAKVIELQKELTAKWDKAMNAGDAEALALLYSEDAIRMEQNQPILKGRDAIRTFFRTYLEKYENIGEDIPAEVIISGEYALVWGTYKCTIKEKSGGNVTHDEGKWMAINKIQPDGSWKIIKDIWNTDLPPVIDNK